MSPTTSLGAHASLPAWGAAQGEAGRDDCAPRSLSDMSRFSFVLALCSGIWQKQEADQLNIG